MRPALMPAAIARARVADIRQLQTSPLRKRPAALASELPSEHRLLTVLISTDDMRTQLSVTTLVDAGHLLFGEDGFPKESIGPARHRDHSKLAGSPIAQANENYSAASLVLLRFGFRAFFSTGAKNFPV
jgi:hypothetical protein